MPGIGASTPCVWGDKIFLTSPDGDDDRPAVRRHRRQGEVEADALEHRSKALPQPLGRRGLRRLCVLHHRRQARLGLRRQRAARLLHRRRQAGLGRRPPEVRQVQHPVRLPLDPGAVQGQALPPGDAPQRPEGRLPRRRHRQGGVGGRDRHRGTARGESPDVYASAFIWEGEGGPLLVAHGNDYCTGHKLDRRRGGLARG